MGLALAILGTLLGVASLTLSLYNLVILKVQQYTLKQPEVVNPLAGRDVARNFFRGEQETVKTGVDNLGMPDVYDPEEEFGTSDELGL